MQGAIADDAGPGMSSTLETVFDALDRDGIRWCVLRGEEDLGAPGGDVDLLVDRSDLPAMKRAIARLGFAPIPAWGYASHCFFLNYDFSDDVWLKLDVVTELAFGPGWCLPTGVESSCLKRRHRRNGLEVLADDDAFWALLLHRVLDKGRVTPAAAARLQELTDRATTTGPIARFLSEVCPAPWTPEALLDAARGGEWESLVEFGAILEVRWRRRAPALVYRRRLANGAWRQAGRFLRPRYRRGLGVAVLAPDGAGKSTLVMGLSQNFFFPVRTLYMGPYRRAERSIAPGFSLASRIGGLWGRWLNGAFHRARGRLVLFDRYPYDSLLPARRRLPRRGLVRRWVLARMCPPPDLTIVLDAPGKVIHERKGELSPQALEAEREAYRALLPRLQDAVIIDAALPVDEVRRAGTAAVWSAYARRWNRWRAP
ncbi:MAG: hypothetical protein ACRDJL_05500 [Actinomycetota bacterium]